MWPVYAAGMLAVAALAVGVVLGVAGAKRPALGAAVLVAVFAVAGVAAYGVTEARYQSCVSDNGISEDSGAVVEGAHYCYRRVFGGVRGDVVSVAKEDVTDLPAGQRILVCAAHREAGDPLPRGC